MATLVLLLLLVPFRVRVLHMLIDAIIIERLAIFEVSLASLVHHIQPVVSLFRVGLLFHGDVYHTVICVIFVSGKVVSRMVQMSVRGP